MQITLNEGAMATFIDIHDNEVVNRNLQEIRAITPERIQSLAFQYLAPETLSTIVVGRME